MEQAQKDVQDALVKTKDQFLAFVNEAKDDITRIPPKDWGIAAAIAVVFSVTLHMFTKEKEDDLFTIGVFIYGLITAALAVLLRKKPLNQQFPLMVVVFSLIRLLIDIGALSVIVLSASPVIVNLVNEELNKKVRI